MLDLRDPGTRIRPCQRGLLQCRHDRWVSVGRGAPTRTWLRPRFNSRRSAEYPMRRAGTPEALAGRRGRERYTRKSRMLSGKTQIGNLAERVGFVEDPERDVSRVEGNPRSAAAFSLLTSPSDASRMRALQHSRCIAATRPSEPAYAAACAWRHAPNCVRQYDLQGQLPRPRNSCGRHIRQCSSTSPSTRRSVTSPAPFEVSAASAGYFALRLRSGHFACGEVAERVGFEPTLRFLANTLSKRAPSATRPPLQGKR